MKVDFRCDVGDILYFVDMKNKVVRKFTVDCLKVFKDNITAHGWLDWRTFSVPYECSIKYLDKEFVFTDKRKATRWLNKRLDKQ